MRVLIQSMAFAVLLALVGATAAPAQDSKIVMVPNDDPEMASAQAKARATLAEFWKAMERAGPGEDGFALKVALPYGTNNAEHMWVNSIERKEGKISGVMNDGPRYVKTDRFGQRIEIPEQQISDWMYLRSGKIVGNHTMRPLLKRLPPAEAARYRAMLADP